MEFEFIEFYPVRIKGDKRFRGTVHIYICNPGIDIRGIVVKKTGSKIEYRMPSKRVVDPEKNEFVFYPIVEFSDIKLCVRLTNFLNEVVTPKIRPTIDDFCHPVWDEKEVVNKENTGVSCKNAKKKLPIS